jgi:hypothetical protein
MFVITTDPDKVGKTWTQPLWWTGHGVVGIMRSGEAELYGSRYAAEQALSLIPQRTVRFHELVVAPRGSNIHQCARGRTHQEVWG